MNEIKTRLLIMDDEQAMCQSLEQFLAGHGFAVTTASSVREGMELLQGHFFDVVVTDLFFPDGNGLDVLRYCTEFCEKTKVICMTGEASTSTAIEALRLGAHDYVPKPFNMEMLLHSINGIVDKIRMEDEIGLARERYRALVEDLKDGYFVLEGRKIVYANQALARLLRTPLTELTGRDFSEFFPDFMKDRLISQLAAFSRKETSAWHEELMLLDCSGNEVPVDVKFNAGQMDGREGLVVGICRQVTERDLLWERLVKAEKLALLGEMTAGIVHELNNKLTPILGFIELLRMEAEDTESQGRIDAIHGAALAARDIVRPLLTFARKEGAETRVADINSLIDTALSMVTATFSTSPVRVELMLNAHAGLVRVDSVQIEQVLTNVMKNAFEAMEGGGVLTVESMSIGNEVAVRISDTGPGIPDEIRESIFKPFFTTKERGKGTGLGLSICREIVQRHGGNIWVRSEDRGTTFVITLPVAAEERAPSRVRGGRMRPNPLVPTTSLMRMLVVDDEQDICRLVKELFASRFNVDYVDNGRLALECMGKRRYDVIISDVKMPVLDGAELYEAIRTKFPNYLKRIIYTTGVTSDPETSIFFQKTGVPYLSKPFKVNQLVAAVESVIGKRMEKSLAA